MDIAAAPQAFTFRTLQLKGLLVGWTGTSRRRYVMHEFIKRDGGRAEDMGEGVEKLQVRLQFLGKDCAREYASFKSEVAKTPAGLLVHPSAGRFYAFCEGPDENVDFNRALDQIEVSCTWVQSELDSTLATDVPDPATAAQNCTGQQATMQQSIANFMGELAKSQTTVSAALGSVDAALEQVAVVTAPVAYVRSVINVALGLGSSIVGKLADIEAASDLLVQDVSNFVDAANDLFTGDSDTAPAGYSDAVSTLLGVTLAHGLALEATLIAASATPAGAADAVADVELMLDRCLTLSEAVAATQPPVVNYTVPAPMNVVVLAQRLIREWEMDRDALEYASIIIGLNRIQNPAMISAGTVLRVLAR